VKKTRILHLIARLPVGGAERVLVDIVRRLDPERYESIVCCIQSTGELAADLEALGIRPVCLGRMRSKRFDWRAIRDLVHLLREQRISLVHSHLYHANLYGRIAAFLCGVPAIATVHNVYAQRKAHRQLFNRLLSKGTARIIAVSEEIRDDLVRHDGIDIAKIAVIHNGIDFQRLETPLTREEARAQLNIQHGVLAIGCVGRLEEQKGHRFLLEATAMLLRDAGLADRLRVLLVGDGRLRKDLESRALALGVAPFVSFLGTRRNVPEILRALDVYAMPSLWEGLSIAMLEAMAAGLPVVMSDVSGAAQAVGDNEYGIRVAPGDPAQLSGAIRLLAEDPAYRRALGLSAKQRVKAKFDVETTMKQLTRVYEEAIANKCD
jgi:L-malate glycosyltransferase